MFHLAGLKRKTHAISFALSNQSPSMRMDIIYDSIHTDKPPHRTGVLCILLCIAVGISNLFHASLLIIFSIICL